MCVCVRLMYNIILYREDRENNITKSQLQLAIFFSFLRLHSVCVYVSVSHFFMFLIPTIWPIGNLIRQYTTYTQCQIENFEMVFFRFIHSFIFICFAFLFFPFHHCAYSSSFNENVRLCMLCDIESSAYVYTHTQDNNNKSDKHNRGTH